MGAKINSRTSPPPRKRARIEDTDASSSRHEACLFAPFRALGLITNGVPSVLQTRSYKGATDGPRINLLTCLGKAWAMWEGGKMGLLFVGEERQAVFVGLWIAHSTIALGPDAPAPISSMAMDGNTVWVSSGPSVIKYVRGKEVRTLWQSGLCL